jgi:hypothetical protein
MVENGGPLWQPCSPLSRVEKAAEGGEPLGADVMLDALGVALRGLGVDPERDQEGRRLGGAKRNPTTGGLELLGSACGFTQPTCWITSLRSQ